MLPEIELAVYSDPEVVSGPLAPKVRALKVVLSGDLLECKRSFGVPAETRGRL